MILQEEIPEKSIPGIRSGLILREQRYGRSWGNPGGFSLSTANAFAPGETALNWKILASHLGVPLNSIRMLRQVHGTGVLRRFREESVSVRGAASPFTGSPAAAAHWTTAEAVVLVVFVADCCPVVVADPDRGIVAIAHAGRQGVVHGIVTALLDEICTAGARRDDLHAWLGPCADGDAYEIGPEVARHFAAYSHAIRPSSGRPGHSVLDMRAVIRSQLDQWGVHPERISSSTAGTISSTRYHSHRRDYLSAGRMVAYAMLTTDDRQVHDRSLEEGAGG